MIISIWFPAVEIYASHFCRENIISFENNELGFLISFLNGRSLEINFEIPLKLWTTSSVSSVDISNRSLAFDVF